jgi:hypothetical protein
VPCTWEVVMVRLYAPSHSLRPPLLSALYFCPGALGNKEKDLIASARLAAGIGCTLLPLQIRLAPSPLAVISHVLSENPAAYLETGQAAGAAGAGRALRELGRLLGLTNQADEAHVQLLLGLAALRSDDFTVAAAICVELDKELRRKMQKEFHGGSCAGASVRSGVPVGLLTMTMGGDGGDGGEGGNGGEGGGKGGGAGRGAGGGAGGETAATDGASSSATGPLGAMQRWDASLEGCSMVTLWGLSAALAFNDRYTDRRARGDLCKRSITRCPPWVRTLSLLLLCLRYSCVVVVGIKPRRGFEHSVTF